MNNKVVLFLMGNKGLKVLEALISHKLTSVIECVIIGKDKNVIKDYSDELKSQCIANNIEFRYRNKQGILTSRLYIAIAWRWLIKHEPDKKLIVFHESLLPKYRGFAPLVNQLINGEKQIGVTALMANMEFDRGPILFQEKITITYPLLIREAIEIVAISYVNIAIKLMQLFISEKELKGENQNEAEASYSLWRDEEDYKINWNENADKIKRLIDAVGFPYNGAYSEIEGEAIRIYEAEEMDDVLIENRTAGKVIFMEDGKPVVVCANGLLKINEALYINNQKSIFPLNKFRIRFK